MPDVVSGKEVPDREVTVPHRPDPRSRQEEGLWPDESSRREVIFQDDLDFFQGQGMRCRTLRLGRRCWTGGWLLHVGRTQG